MCVVYNVIAFFVFFFLTSFTSILNLITSCFCSSRFPSTSFFHFLFCLIFSFLDLQFFWTTISPTLRIKKNSSIYPFFDACVTSVFPIAHRFVHLLSLFLSSCFLVPNTYVSLFLLSSVHNLSERQVCGTVAKKKKLVCLFPCCWALFLSLSCFFLLKKNCKMIICSTFFNLFWTLHFFQHRLCRKNFMFCVYRSLFLFMFFFHLFFMWFFVWCFSISFATCFPFKMSSLPLYFLFLFILFPSVLFFCLLLFSRFFHLFSLFKLPFFCLFIISMFFVSNSLWKKSF